MANVDRGLAARLDELGDVKWDKSLLQNTVCPFLRAGAAAGVLDIKTGENDRTKPVLVATVDSVRRAGRGIGSVLAFFARFNHTRGLHPGQTKQIEGLSKDTFNLDQTTSNNTSDGTHDGTVDIIDGSTGMFNALVVDQIRKIVGSASVLTPDSIAEVIVASNHADFSKVSHNKEGSIVDLAKSAGEWALMFCLLKDDEGNVPIANLEALCRDARIPQHAWDNLDKSSVREWVHFTTAITANIAHVKHRGGEPEAASGVMDAMHDVWSKENDGVGCGCDECTQGKAGFWDNPLKSIKMTFDKLRTGKASIKRLTSLLTTN